MNDRDVTAVTDALLEGRVMEATLIATEDCELDRALNMMACLRPNGPLVGDILVESWGYEQTNIDFYEVVAVTKGGKVRIREIHSKTVADHEYTVDVMPVPGSFVPRAAREVLTGRAVYTDPKGAVRGVKMGAYNIGYRVKISDYSSARLWDGEPESQTGALYGH